MIQAKKKSILIKVALGVFGALVAMWLFFFSPIVQASAATSTNESMLYWANGAAATSDVMDNYEIKFYFKVSESAFDEDEDHVAVALPEMEGISINRVRCDYRTSGWYLIDCTVKNANVVAFPKSELTFADDGWATVHVIVQVNDVRQDVSLVAGVYDKILLGAAPLYKATSDTRNLLYIWGRALEAEDPVILENPYISDATEFYNSANVDKFLISSAVQISETRGMSILFNIPEAWRELLYNSKTEKTLLYNPDDKSYEESYKYVDNYLLVRLHDTLEAAQNPSLKYDGIYHKFYGSNEHGKVEGKALPVSFKTHTNGFIDIPLPATETSYVTLQIVERTVSYGYERNENPNWKIWDLYDLKEKAEETLVATSENYQTFSIKQIAQEALERNLALNENQKQWLQDVAGLVPQSKTIPVTIRYKTMSGYANVRDAVKQVWIPSSWAFERALVESKIYEHAKDFRSIADFNVKYVGAYHEDSLRYETESRIILQANSMDNYVYNPETESATIDVVYDDYKYKDLCIRVTNNDSDNHLTMNYYTTNVKVGAENTTITYGMRTIEKHLYNSCRWLFKLEGDKITHNAAEGVDVAVGEDDVTVTVANDKVNNLMNLSLTAVAEIIPDVDCSVTYKYARYAEGSDGKLKVEWISSEPFTMLYSKINAVGFDYVEREFGEQLEEALTFERLDGTYYTPINSHVNKLLTAEDEQPKHEIVVEYDKNAVFMVTDNLNSKPYYKALSNDSCEYDGTFFVAKESIPSGHRISKMESSSSAVAVSSQEDYTQSNVVVNVNQYQDLIIPISITYTDSWYLLVNYMQQIAGTPFAELKSQKTQIRVADYEDIYALTEDDLKKILKVTSFDITSMVTLDKISVTFDNVSLYTVDVSYTQASLRMLNYEGETEELKVPLTSYADWCASFGKDWTILMLNQPGKTYFRFDNTVAREKLYGLFSVAVFSEQVSDLNYWFKNTTGDGQITMFSAKKTEGSAVYKFFDNLRTNGPLMSLAGHVGMALCEILNDENQMLHSYYLYLDGTNPNGAYVSNGGADDAFDDDTAIENKGEDIVEDVKDAVSGFKESTFGKVLTVLVAVLTGTAVAIGIIWLLKKLKLLPKRRAKTSKTKRSSKPKAKRSKAKVK